MLEKNQVGNDVDLPCFVLMIPLDIYIVADSEGNEMVLKLHRSVLAYSVWTIFDR